MALIDTNLASTHLKALLRRDGKTARIEYAANGGGYESNVYFVTKDGGVLSIDTVIAEINEVDFTDESDSQWYITGYDVNYENADLIDDHTGKAIPAAHAD